jgi:ABC-type multidrug transport system fused ATPase/permease subunit
VLTYLSVQYFRTPAVTLLAFFYIFIRLAQGASEANSLFGELRLQKSGFMELLKWDERTQSVEASGKIDLLKEPVPDVENGIEITAKNISFSYQDGKPVLKNISLSVKSGEVLLIRGESGSGKSTLASVLLGLFVPSTGAVMINGKNVLSVRDDLYQKLGYVGPEPYMIPGTIRENLMYGNPFANEISDEEIWTALKSAHVFTEINALKSGLNEVMKDFAHLSTGQKQRLSFARALLRKPKILLLDEATANLDSSNEKKIVESIESLKSSITTIVISHKESFDRIATSKVLVAKS